jgi:hypothetical protein
MTTDSKSPVSRRSVVGGAGMAVAVVRHHAKEPESVSVTASTIAVKIMAGPFGWPR